MDFVCLMSQVNLHSGWKLPPQILEEQVNIQTHTPPKGKPISGEGNEH